MDDPGRILIATVGLGNIDHLRSTLLEPMKLSIRAGDWKRVILVPSVVTGDLALKLREELAGLPVELRPLPQAGDEDDLVRSREHFEAVVRSVLQSGASPDEVVVDFTRGTKVMSVAAVMAAISSGIRHFQYVVGGQRDSRGVVVPGTEKVRTASL